MNPLASFELDYNSGLPVWIQVKNRIAYLIGSGEYKAGDQLPTVRSLAVDLDISYNTVNRAYMDLEREGYISTRKGRGTFVAERHAVGAALAADNPVELLADDLIRTCANAGMADDDILALVQARLAPLGREPLLVDEETCVAAIRDARDMRPVRCSARASARLCRAKREGGEGVREAPCTTSADSSRRPSLHCRSAKCHNAGFVQVQMFHVKHLYRIA